MQTAQYLDVTVYLPMWPNRLTWHDDKAHFASWIFILIRRVDDWESELPAAMLINNSGEPLIFCMCLFKVVRRPMIDTPKLTKFRANKNYGQITDNI